MDQLLSLGISLLTPMRSSRVRHAFSRSLTPLQSSLVTSVLPVVGLDVIAAMAVERRTVPRVVGAGRSTWVPNEELALGVMEVDTDNACRARAEVGSSAVCATDGAT
jgi:hypothetical protein